MHRLLCSLLGGKEPSRDLLDLASSSAFSLLRCEAQRELRRRKSYTHAAVPPYVRSLCDLVSGLEVLQRMGSTFKMTRNVRVTSDISFRSVNGSAFYGSKAVAGLGQLEFGSPVRPGTSSRLRKEFSASSVTTTVSTSVVTDVSQESVKHVPCTASPVLIRTQSYCIEVDLQPCAASVLDALHSVTLTEAVTPKGKEVGAVTGMEGSSKSPQFVSSTSTSTSSFHSPRASSKHSQQTATVSAIAESYGTSMRAHDDDIAIIEVAIAVGAASDDNNDGCPLFETVYCGSALIFRQVGLSPNTSYLIRCRAAASGVVMDWSPSVEFITETGISFTFDPLKCGPDIVLAEDNLKASYRGDDSWSTLLGTQPFSAGKAGWEIRVTHSSTAYLFVGVATSEADLNTFLGGCNNGWGFIGEQALYHSRENVKGYGEAFNAGDFIGVSLDFHLGTLSFSRNGKLLGVAFDKMCGELYPAVAFYNVGQELEIIPEGFRTSCCQDAIQCTPARLDLHGTLLMMILLLHVLSWRCSTSAGNHDQCNYRTKQQHIVLYCIALHITVVYYTALH